VAGRRAGPAQPALRLVGDRNNMANTWIEAPGVGLDLDAGLSDGYQPNSGVAETALGKGHGRIGISRSAPRRGWSPRDLHDVFASMARKRGGGARRAFVGYGVDAL